jgi:glutamyl/glutaminyl-tRNA synthetase
MLISRLAPTPNGELHWGNLLNFATTWSRVRKQHGKLWLRFDDIDQDRCEERFAEDTRTVLKYLGLAWDAESSNQIARLSEYRETLGKIPHYVCDCSRQEIYRRTGDFHYDGHCRTRNLSYVPLRSAIRFASPKGPAHDFVLWRREDIPSYHLTCVHDDTVMGVNLIIRGEDLLESTEVQKELSKALPGDPFSSIVFVHHPLILGVHGEKLSKSRGDGELMTLIRQGRGPEELWGELGKLVGRPLRSPADL